MTDGDWTMKRIEARDSIGTVKVFWPVEDLEKAKRLCKLSSVRWTLGVVEYESAAEADEKRLDWIQDHIWVFKLMRVDSSIRRDVDIARNAPKPVFTPIDV